MLKQPRLSLTEKIKKRYDRRSRFYDFMEKSLEIVWFSGWRKTQWSKVEGRQILEVGVGTGKNLRYHPSDREVTGIDFSEDMLARGKRRAARLGSKARLVAMDVQDLEFADATFDTVAASFVFCSVPDPVRGLEEVARVCIPGGRVVLLEHVRSANRFIARMMDFFNPLFVLLTGANMNRRTVDNLTKAGLTVEKVTNLRLGVFKLIEARKK